MTRDDIIRMAKEAGFNQILATNTGADVWIDDGFYVEEMERFAALVAAEKDKEIEQMQVALTEAHAVRETCNQRAFRLEAEIDRLREALKTYGQHHNNCAAVLGGYQCTCGFNQQEQPK